MSTYNQPALEALQAAGGPAGLADGLLRRRGSSQGRKKLQWRVAKWKYNSVPPEWVLDVEAVTGISRHRLRPDIYGDAA